MFKIYLCILVLIMLTSCDYVSNQAPSGNVSTTIAMPVTVSPLVQTSISIPNVPTDSIENQSSTNTVVPSDDAMITSTSSVISSTTQIVEALSDNWIQVSWSNLRIDIPPHATWISQATTTSQFGTLHIVYGGHIQYPHNENAVEGPQGPTFFVIEFPGSLNEWMEFEKQSIPQNAIDEASIKNTSVSGIQALSYQREVRGVGNAGYYALKINDEQILWIATEDIDNDLYRTIIQRVHVV